MAKALAGRERRKALTKIREEAQLALDELAGVNHKLLRTNFIYGSEP